MSVPLPSVGVVVEEKKSNGSGATVYVTAALFGVILGIMIAFIYLAYRGTSINPTFVSCTANNFLYREIQKLPPNTSNCLNNYFNITPQVCT